MSMENHGGMILTVENSWFVHQSTLWQCYQESHLAANQEEHGEGDDELSLQSILFHMLKWFFTCRKIVQNGADGFTCPLNEGVLQICITLKNPSSSLGLNPRTLGPMASMLTITPLRRLVHQLDYGVNYTMTYGICCSPNLKYRQSHCLPQRKTYSGQWKSPDKSWST
jgi:hypothetical protein